MLDNIKVVAKPLGTSIGEMNVSIGMPVVNRGYIASTGISTLTIGTGHGGDDYASFGAGNPSGVFTLYPSQCAIASGDAAAFGWPTTGGSIVYGHVGGINTGGSPKAAFLNGFEYMTGGTASQLVPPASGFRPDVLN